jgi:catechol 2,3-dioxygenase-like lactoylglutathione lyase family enzyme
MTGIGVKQLAHVCVLTHDLKATEDFYCTVLGFRKVFDFTRKGELFGFYLDTGSRTNIEVFENTSAPFRQQGQVDHLCLEVEDLDKALEVLRHHGIEIRDNKKKMGVDDTWQAWIKDPSGTKIELMEYTAKSAQFVGGDREANW